MRHLFLLILSISVAYGSCQLPQLFCARLYPGMVAFIGSPTLITRDSHQRLMVTFNVVEKLVGLRDVSQVTVLFADGFSKTNEPQLLVVTPTGDGRYRHDDCGSGIRLSLNDPRAKSLRRDVASRAPAFLTIQARSKSTFVNIPDVRVRLRGGGRSFEGTSRGRSAISFGAVPPGEYEVTAQRSHFSLAIHSRRINLLPGSCAVAITTLESTSQFSGRLLDARGRPVAHSRLLLKGTTQDLARSQAERKALPLRDRSQWINASAHRDTRTTSDGRFQFGDVYPGWYRLVTDVEEAGSSTNGPLPETYHPGVPIWTDGTEFVIDEGQSVNGVVFRLPDFGTKRNVVFRVVNEKGVPVVGAKVHDHSASHARAGKAAITDRNGEATISLWPHAEYLIMADVTQSNTRFFSGPMRITASKLKGKPTLRLTRYSN